MMIDTSAILAILFDEPERKPFSVAILRSAERKMSAPNFLEASMLALARRGEDGQRMLDLLIAKLGIEIVPFTVAQGQVARSAFKRFGKGRHQAGLNFGDCIAYAAAVDYREAH